MNASDTDTPYCRLYIDTGESREAVQTLLDGLTSSCFERLRVSAPVFKNDGSGPDGNHPRPYDPIEESQWTVEIDAEDNSPQAFEAFQAGICVAIEGLRDAGFIVTASCAFEQRVAVETGWNWTVENPEPPALSVRIGSGLDNWSKPES